MDAATRQSSRWSDHSQWAATLRLCLAAVVGTAVALAIALAIQVPLAVLCGLTAMSVFFDVSALVALTPMRSERTRENARREAFQPIVEEIAVVGVAVGSVVAIAFLQVLGDTDSRDAAAGVGLLGIFAIWGMLHIMYATRYANLYYDAGEHGSGIDFNDDGPPAYRDFLYFSFTIAMTYGTSDCTITAPHIRTVVLRHGLLSFVFGTVILAATINLVAGIVTG